MIRSSLRVLAVLLGLAAASTLLDPAVGVGGQEAPPLLDEPVQPHPEGEAAIDRLRSPYCPGLMLEVCPSPQAKLLRDSIQALAWEGASSDSLVNWMLANHGEEYRAVPRTRGSGLFAWLIPPLALVAGLVIVVMTLQHLRGRRDTSAPEEEEEALSEEDEEALEEALDELKKSEEVPF
jgi:cytochrome c-type biogenesis protein CcmH/NrfF